MMKEQKKMNNKGFSLVELIIVIAIMAILVGALAPQFMKYVERSRKSTDVQNVAAAITAMQAYAADPMVASGDELKSGTLTLKYKAAMGPEANKNIDKALASAGITDIQLKSNKWGSGDITITVTVNATTGAVTFSESGLTNASILEGSYQ